MACESIDKLPTDVVSHVVRYLSIGDIKNLRQVSKWAERESFNAFAARGYGRMTRGIALNTTGPLMKILEDSSGLAEAVRMLKLCLTRTQANGDAGMIARLLAALPQLDELHLIELRQANFAQHLQYTPNLPIGLRARLAISRFSLSDSFIRGSELLALMQEWGSTLRYLKLVWIRNQQGNWYKVLAETITSCPGLTRLYLDSLTTVVPGQNPSIVYVQDEDARRFVKAFKGEDGVEMVNMSAYMADMKGKEAICMGLERILSHIGST